MRSEGYLKVARPVEELCVMSYGDLCFVPWRTNVVAVPPPAKCMCFDALAASATGLSMPELGLPWCLVTHSVGATFKALNNVLKVADGPGKLFQLSKEGLHDLSVRDVFKQSTGECSSCVKGCKHRDCVELSCCAGVYTIHAFHYHEDDIAFSRQSEAINHYITLNCDTGFVCLYPEVIVLNEDDK